MFIDRDDKTIVFHPEALKVIRGWLGEVEQTLIQTGTLADMSTRNAESRVRALAQILNAGFGTAARVTPDTPEGSLFVAEYATAEQDAAAYVFGCVKHSDGQIGVHS